MNLSVVIITKNEEEDLPRVLGSVEFANEVIVVDSGSTDRTVEIALAHGAKLFEADWLGYGPQKNFALDKASGDWVLSLDADEWLDPSAQRQLVDLIARVDDQDVVAYSFPRRSKFIDRFIRWGDWRSDRVTRLFRKGQGRFSDDSVHERLVVEGQVEGTNITLLHHPFKTLDTTGLLRKGSIGGGAVGLIRLLPTLCSHLSGAIS
jgi:glycosyltransferase involved in cell wall biosynthesis